MKTEKTEKRKKHPLLFLIGYSVCETSAYDLPRLIDLCRAHGVAYRESEICGDRAFLTIPFFSLRKLKREAAGHSIEINVRYSCGIPALLVRYRHRYGIILGFIVSVALIILSGSVIWDVRIDGAEKLCESDVKKLLSDCGLEAGTFRRSLDIDVLENRVLILSDDISWISINVIGTVAEVEIREVDFADDRVDDDAANLIALCDGKIVGFEDARGNISVDIGEQVREGQLLIGGVYGDEESGIRYTRARGRVLAEVERDFEIEVPRVEQKKVYKEYVKCEKSLVFFKKRIKFFSNCRNLSPTCDKIEVDDFIKAWGIAGMPVGIHETRCFEYEYVENSRDDETLAAIADARLNALLSSEFADAQMLRKYTSYELSDDKLVLRCRIKCVTDIAQVQKIALS